MQYHVHVYSLARMVDLDVEASSPHEAKQKALKFTDTLTTKSPEVKLPDCKKIALVWDETTRLVSIGDDTDRTVKPWV